jgi:chromate transporter
MNHSSPVMELTLHLAVMSLMAVGGGVVLLGPDVSHYVVDARHWLSGEQFAAAYAIAQAAPGPNMLFISLVGWLIAGWAGAVCTTLAVIVPSTLLTLFVIRMNLARHGGRLTRALSDAFAPMSIGFLAATAWLFAQMSNSDWRGDVLTLVSALIVLRSKLNPVVLIAAGAVLGATQL